jgi:hypothetical protein
MAAAAAGGAGGAGAGGAGGAAAGGAGGAGGAVAVAVPFPLGQYKVKSRFVVLHERAPPYNTILLGQGKIIGVETPGQTDNFIKGIIFGGETDTGDVIPDARKTEITFSRTFVESDMPQITRANGSRKNRRTTRNTRNRKNRKNRRSRRNRRNTRNSRTNQRRI